MDTPVTNTIGQSRIGSMTYLGPIASMSDEQVVDQLQNIINECIENQEIQIVLDLAKVSSLNSQSMELLEDLNDMLILLGGWIKVTNPNEVVQLAIKATGLDNHVSDISSTTKKQAAFEIKSQPSKRLGDILIDNGFVTAGQIAEARNDQEQSGMRLGQILIDKGWVTEEQMITSLSEQMDIPFITLRPGLYDPDIANIIVKDVALRLEVLPLFKIRNEITLATYDPHAITSFDEVEELTDCKVRPVLAQRPDIIDHIYETYTRSSYISEYMNGATGLSGQPDSRTNGFSTIDDTSDESPVIKLVNTLIQRAIHDGVSDIHIEPTSTKTSVRYRIDGILHEAMTPPLEMHPAIVSRLKVMAKLDIAERRLPQDGRIQVTTQGRTVDLRFSSLPGIYGEVVVLRVLDKNQTIQDINKIGLDNTDLDRIKTLLSQSNGLILVTGPTGSGKTTTLYSALNHINSIKKNTVTIEDPVEYQVDMINQNQVNESIGLTFARTLKHILRQDPDIIMVGEIRDKETAEITIHAALTGHLVLSTLHTNDAPGSINRLVDMGIEPYLLSSALIGIVAQRLVRKICPECKTSHEAPSDLVEKYGWKKTKKVKISYGEGCAACYDSGYKGRLGLYEIVVVDNALQKLIVSNPSHDELMAHIKKQKHKTLFADGLEQVLKGNTTIEEVSRVISET
ncbi:MAG: ATPase, T2SS/T4P/T4SS family [Gammaproteobacteria bacterium]